MYQFHYEYIGTKYNNSTKFYLQTDYDTSFFLQTQIESDDVYEDSYENKSFFDFCDYPEDSKFFDPVYEKLLRKMKDEFKGK